MLSTNSRNKPPIFTHYSIILNTRKMKKFVGIFALLAFMGGYQTVQAQSDMKKQHAGKVETTLEGSPEMRKQLKESEKMQSKSEEARDNQGNRGEAAGEHSNKDGQKHDDMRDAVGHDADTYPDAVGAEQINTEGMSPAQASKAKFMARNEKTKRNTATAEEKLAKSKAAIAKSKASLEAKHKSKKISEAEYKDGLAKIKTAEERCQYLESMIGEAKAKTF